MIKIASNGQWTLAKSDEAPKGPAPTSLHGLIGKTHTVEVHPHIDHLYRLKNFITQSAQAMPIRAIKQSEFGHLADKLPRDASGRVTPDMIDKHIATLPKHKVEVKVVPYKMGAQQHRDDVPQYAVSVGLHPDTLKKMSPNKRNFWDHIRSQQHDLDGHEHQVGWARIDPYKVHEGESGHAVYPEKYIDTEALPERLRHLVPQAEAHISRNNNKKIVPNEGHWHIDEIQSDFGVPKVIDHHLRNYTDPEEIARNIGLDAYDIFHRKTWPGGGTTSEERHKKFVEQHPELTEDLGKYLERRQKRKDTHEAIHAKYKEQGLISEHGSFGEHSARWTDEQIENADRIREEMDANIAHWDEQDKPWDAKVNELAKRYAKEREGPKTKDIHQILSHGHEDPMHMIHSAVNQLGRQNGIESMSMDMPNHQAHQSGLRPSNAPEEDDDGRDYESRVWDHIADGRVSDQQKHEMWNTYGGANLIGRHDHDINFKSAYKKLGDEGLKQWANLALSDNSSWFLDGSSASSEWDERTTPSDPDNNYFSPEIGKKLLEMSPAERDSLSRFLGDYSRTANAELANQLGFTDDEQGWEDQHPDFAEYDDLPVHQINTYDKRPKKLGFQPVDKKHILGEHPNDQYNLVQYAKLHKKLRLIQELLRKA